MVSVVTLMQRMCQILNLYISVNVTVTVVNCDVDAKDTCEQSFALVTEILK